MAGKKSETGNASVNNLVDLLLGRKGEKDNKEAFDICKKSAELGDYGSMGRLGRMYRDGIGTEANLDLAIEYMGKAFGRGIKWADKEYLDLLLLRNTEKDNKEAFDICKKSAELGDYGSMGRLGRMYRDGIGTEANLDLAIEYMGKAFGRGIKWADKEYLDLLLLRNTEKDNKEAFEKLVHRALMGDLSSLEYVGRMYRDGTFLTRDERSATDIMMLAYRNGSKSVRMNLVDMIYSNEYRDYYVQAFEICGELAEENNAGGYGRLARMYRDGIGTEVDLNMAADWMEKALKNNIGWAKLELTDILIARSNESDKKRAFELCSELTEENNAGGYGRLARMYRDGWGVNADSNKAKSMMKKAADMGVKWAQDEYAKMF